MTQWLLSSIFVALTLTTFTRLWQVRDGFDMECCEIGVLASKVLLHTAYHMKAFINFMVSFLIGIQPVYGSSEW